MRTTQAANQSKQVWDGKTRWAWNGPEDGTDVFSKDVSHTVQRLASTKLNGSIRTYRKQGSETPHFILKSRQVVLQTSRSDDIKGQNVKTRVKSNSLPPIFASRATSARVKSCASCLLVENKALQTGRKTFLASDCVARTSRWRQKERGELTSTADLIYRSLATINVSERCQKPDRVHSERASRSPLNITQSNLRRQLCLDEKSLSSSDSTVITDRIQNPVSVSEHKPHPEPLSDSDKETESSHKIAGMRQEERKKKGTEEEVYYTTEVIAEWIVRVNASLFSPYQDGLLKEEDVDTIKIVYNQD